MMFTTVAISNPSSPAFLDSFGTADDTTTDSKLEVYLSSAPERSFRNWGKEGKVLSSRQEDGNEDEYDKQWSQGSVKALWPGIIEISADAHPWVGRVLSLVSGRIPQASGPGQGYKLAALGK
ncbi:hypothetical protein BDV98DRAFT_586749 [Pterulicium gracile]|uniref:Uncharacterized protein n=1 Tax=Pterulicium gracile TaxID=1884261 RepID=A0A5C3Q6W5_9AGAR|nr:hypothetical protein BDV98DRAFT_586749 [Pterula gracilis]